MVVLGGEVLGYRELATMLGRAYHAAYDAVERLRQLGLVEVSGVKPGVQVRATGLPFELRQAGDRPVGVSRHLARARALQAVGRCSCGREAQPGRKKCAVCVAARALVQQAAHDAGLCWCGKPPVPGHQTCELCTAKKRRRRQRARAAGLCQCGQAPRAGKRTCQRCANTHARYYQRKRLS